MGHECIADNLKRVRIARSLTQADVAKQAGLSLAAYRNAESGTAVPRVDSLQRLAQALDVRIQDLFIPVKKLTHVRFRAGRRLNSRDEILAKTSRWLENFNGLEAILDDRVENRLPEIRKLIGRNKAPKNVATIARKELLKSVEAGINQEPIRDICGLLEARGVKVYALQSANSDFFGLSVGEGSGGPAIAVNVWERISVERWIFTAAHELGHLLLHFEDDYDVDQVEEKPTDPHEREADEFAAYFLMPPEIFDKEWEETSGAQFLDRVLKVKRMFRVSWKTVVYRLIQKGGGEHLWAKFFGEYKARHGRSLRRIEEPHALSSDQFRPLPLRSEEPAYLLPEDFFESRLHRLVREGLDEGKISQGKAAELLELPIVRLRELMRSWVM